MSEEKIYLMLDLETTGLDPIRDSILEVACFPINLEELTGGDHFEEVFPFGDPPEHVAEIVRQMHTKNRLWDACKNAMISKKTHTEVYERLHAYLVGLGAKDSSIVLCGNTIQFDRQFLRFAPLEIWRLLHHRVLDVSSLLPCAESWTGATRPKKREAHRAYEDCLESLALLRWCREAFGA